MGQQCCPEEAQDNTTPNTQYGRKSQENENESSQSKSVIPSQSAQSVAMMTDIGDDGQIPQIQQEVLNDISKRDLSLRFLQENDSAFISFIDKHLTEKVVDKVWDKLDDDGDGYLETSSMISDAISFLLFFYQVQLHKKQKKKGKLKTDNKKKLVQAVEHLSIWLVIKHGKKYGHKQEDVYEVKWTKEMFLENLSDWLREYVEEMDEYSG